MKYAKGIKMGVAVGEKEAIMKTIKALNKLSDKKKRKIV